MSDQAWPRVVLVTGGAGFIGSNFIRWLLEHDPAVQIRNFDLLTYAGNLESLTDVEQRHGASGSGRYQFIKGDVRSLDQVTQALASVDAAVHLAAESHVDRSIMGPSIFVDTNVRGTLTLLEACRAELQTQPRRFRLLHVSTDEVHGSLGPDDPPFTENTSLAPRSPYSASKAGADLLVRAYVETFDLPAVITRCSNNYGPYQFPEKLIPLMIIRALHDERLPVYSDGQHIRDWLFVDDHAEALWTILLRGVQGAVYNIGGENQVRNLDVVRSLLRMLDKPDSLITFVADRPGHDRRYAMDTNRLRQELGWGPRHSFEEGLRETVTWYLEHQRWWHDVLSEAYRMAELYLE
jgi:dTDP-glucose 4,6-dehydratase